MAKEDKYSQNYKKTDVPNKENIDSNSAFYASDNTTTAKPVDKDSGYKYSPPTIPGLLETYILRYFPIPSLVAIIVFGFIYVQDNNAGRLQDCGGILWAFCKAGLFLLVTCVFYLVPIIIKKIGLWIK